MAKSRNRNPFPGTVRRGKAWSYAILIDGKQLWKGGFRTQRDAFEAKTDALAKRNQGSSVSRRKPILIRTCERSGCPV